MCLITRQVKPFIAKEDIVCYKYLDFSSANDKIYYRTPYQDRLVTLDKVMVADSYKSYRGEAHCKHHIGEGFVHAVIGKADIIGCTIVKAIIPEGTEFYIGDDCISICSRKLFLTKEIVNECFLPDPKMAIRELFKDYLSNLFVSDKIGVGYYRLADGSYLNPKDLTEELKLEVIGVVAYIHYGKVGIVSLYEGDSLPWKKWVEDTEFDCPKQYRIVESAKRDYDGKDNTESVLLKPDFSKDNYPSFAYVNNYKTKGTKKGDWYFPSAGELIELFDYNMFLVNVSLSLLDDGETFGNINIYWTSTESSCYFAYCINDGNAILEKFFKKHDFKVRPFLQDFKH